MCLKLGHISAAIYIIRHFVAGLQISRRGKIKNFVPTWHEVPESMMMVVTSRQVGAKSHEV